VWDVRRAFLESRSDRQRLQHGLAVTVTAGCMLLGMGCRERGPVSQSDGGTVKLGAASDWNAMSGKRVMAEGIARTEFTKAHPDGEALVLARGIDRVVMIREISTWPTELEGKEVEVEGVLYIEKLGRQPGQPEDLQGYQSGTTIYWLQNAKWWAAGEKKQGR